ncbi:MAG: MMPL family transporter [Syntrophobacteraceae bacterium]
MKILLRILQLWMAWVLPWPRLVLGIASLLAFASIAITVSKLDIVTDQLELISENHPLITLNDRLDPFNSGSKGKLTVVVEAPTPERAVAFAKGLIPRIKEDTTHFQDIFYRLDTNLVKPWVLLYLEKDEVVRLRDAIIENEDFFQGISEHHDLLDFLKLTNREMASAMVGEMFTGFLGAEDSIAPKENGKNGSSLDLGFLILTLKGLSGYLDGSPIYKSPWASLFQDSARDLELEGYFWEGGKKYLLLFVIPEKTGDEFTEAQSSLDRLRNVIREVQGSFPDVKAGVTGHEALGNDEMTTVLGDMTRATWISILGVCILMVFFFRSMHRTLIEITALMIGLCWTFGWTTLFIGHLNILSVVFAPLLCGLGVHYGIHWFARYAEEERNTTFDLRSVIQVVTERSGPAILLAGLSAAFSFLPLVLTGFRGLVELGLIAGVGILLILIADFTVLPAMVILIGKRTNPRGYILSIGTYEKDLLRLNSKTARRVLAGAGILCIASFWTIDGVNFDLNPLRLQASNAESVIWEKTLVENSQRSLLSASVIARTPEEVLEKTKALKALPSVAEVESAYSLIPEEQEEKLVILRPIVDKLPELTPTVLTGRPSDIKDLVEVLERIRFKMQDDQALKAGADEPLVKQMACVRSLADGIIRVLQSSPDAASGPLFEYRKCFRDDLLNTLELMRRGVSTHPMTIQNIPMPIREWFFSEGTYLLRVYPKDTIWEQDALTRFVREVQSVDPQAAGDPVSLYVFAAAFKKACMDASIYAVITILVLLFLSFRRLSLTFLALMPLGVGTLWTVGIMGIANIQFNLANSMFMPLIVGAGVEYAVVILNRWREGTMEPGHLPMSTGKGVILAALTTTVGYGTLMISHHRGIFSLGFIAFVGSLCVLIAAVTLLPAVLAQSSSKNSIHPYNHR